MKAYFGPNTAHLRDHAHQIGFSDEDVRNFQPIIAKVFSEWDQERRIRIVGDQGPEVFADLLLHALHSVPAAKEQLMASINMTEEDVEDLKPSIAKAWSDWDRNGRSDVKYTAEYTPTSSGQEFAKVALASFWAVPLSKKHILTTLRMTNNELSTTMQPVVGKAWDEWDQKRRS